MTHKKKTKISHVGSDEEISWKRKPAALTIFPLKSMFGNFLLMYFMADSIALSVSSDSRCFGSAQLCQKWHRRDGLSQRQRFGLAWRKVRVMNNSQGDTSSLLLQSVDDTEEYI